MLGRICQSTLEKNPTRQWPGCGIPFSWPAEGLLGLTDPDLSHWMFHATFFQSKIGMGESGIFKSVESMKEEIKGNEAMGTAKEQWASRAPVASRRYAMHRKACLCNRLSCLITLSDLISRLGEESLTDTAVVHHSHGMSKSLPES